MEQVDVGGLYSKNLCLSHKMLRSNNSIIFSVMKFLYTVMNNYLLKEGSLS